jgi:hypothetical protein
MPTGNASDRFVMFRIMFPACWPGFDCFGIAPLPRPERCRDAWNGDPRGVGWRCYCSLI